jgi:hypothetical protein
MRRGGRRRRGLPVDRGRAIRDSIHGDIFLTEGELRIIDTPIFQRLRRIKQLGLNYLVYPSANHTRFEHSLGATHLAGRLADRLALGEAEGREVRLAALLHDIGHGPLSHTSEEFLRRYFNLSHEGMTEKLVCGPTLAPLLDSIGVRPERVAEILAGEGAYLSRMISGEFDVDRMDYLVRDSHHTGVAYGVIDLDRIVHTLELEGSSLAVREGGLRAVEGLLVARFLMTPTVYLHHTSRIADAMFLRATEAAVQEGVLSLEDLFTLDDGGIQERFRRASGYVREIGERFDQRRLFKVALLRRWSDLEEDVRDRVLELRRDPKSWRRIEDEMAQEAGVDSGYLILDIPELPESQESDALVRKDNGIWKLEEVSPLARILKEAHKDHWSVGVYAPREGRERAGRVASSLSTYLS